MFGPAPILAGTVGWLLALRWPHFDKSSRKRMAKARRQAPPAERRKPAVETLGEPWNRIGW